MLCFSNRCDIAKSAQWSVNEISRLYLSRKAGLEIIFDTIFSKKSAIIIIWAAQS